MFFPLPVLYVVCVFSSQIYSFDVNEIYPVFDSDLCVYRCCCCLYTSSQSAIRLVSSSGERNLITYKSSRLGRQT